MKIKKKTLGRVEWYNDKQRDFKHVYYKDEYYEGAIGLITFTGLEEPEMVQSELTGETCIGDNGYQWLEFVPIDKNWVLTSMFTDEGKLFQLYFDISKNNTVDEAGDATFDDVFLDVTLDANYNPKIIDQDELDSALDEGIVSKEEYELYKKTAEEIVLVCMEKRELIVELLYKYHQMMQK